MWFATVVGFFGVNGTSHCHEGFPADLVGERRLGASYFASSGQYILNFNLAAKVCVVVAAKPSWGFVARCWALILLLPLSLLVNEVD